MTFDATSRVAGSSVNFSANFVHTVSSASDISPDQANRASIAKAAGATEKGVKTLEYSFRAAFVLAVP